MDYILCNFLKCENKAKEEICKGVIHFHSTGADIYLDRCINIVCYGQNLTTLTAIFEKNY